MRTVVHVVSSFLFSLDAYSIYFEAIARKISVALVVKSLVKIRTKFKWFDRSIQLKFGPNFLNFLKFVHFGGLRNFLAFESQNLARSQCSKSNKCFNRVGRCNRKCSKLGLNLSCSNGSLEMDSLNPTQEFNLNQTTPTKRGWGGL